MSANKLNFILIPLIIISVISGPVLAYSVVTPIAEHCLRKDKFVTDQQDVTPVTMNLMPGHASNNKCMIKNANNVAVIKNSTASCMGLYTSAGNGVDIGFAKHAIS